jgi:hypothetical protein
VPTAVDVRAILATLPGAEEVPKWGSPHFVVGAKLFGGLDAERGVVSLKASREAQAALLASEPETFGVAPYVGRYGWVTVQLASVDGEELRELMIEAWRRTAPKRAVARFDAELERGSKE